MADSTIVLRMVVNREDLYFDTKLSTPPAVGTCIRVVPAHIDYKVLHSVSKVRADPFSGQYIVTVSNAGSELSSANAARFSLILQSYGWRKS